MTWTGIIIFTIIVCLVAGVWEYLAQRKANEFPFTDTSEIDPEADSARFHGKEAAV